MKLKTFEEFVNESLADSQVMRIIMDNMNLTHKRDGPVRVTTGRRDQLTVSLKKDKQGKWNPDVLGMDATEIHQIQGTAQKSGKWKIIMSKGVAEINKKTATDEEVAEKVQKIFDLVK
jgi:hypothetical protein